MGFSYSFRAFIHRWRHALKANPILETVIPRCMNNLKQYHISRQQSRVVVRNKECAGAEHGYDLLLRKKLYLGVQYICL